MKTNLDEQLTWFKAKFPSLKPLVQPALLNPEVALKLKSSTSQESSDSNGSSKLFRPTTSLPDTTSLQPISAAFKPADGTTRVNEEAKENRFKVFDLTSSPMLHHKGSQETLPQPVLVSSSATGSNPGANVDDMDQANINSQRRTEQTSDSPSKRRRTSLLLVSSSSPAPLQSKLKQSPLGKQRPNSTANRPQKSFHEGIKPQWGQSKNEDFMETQLLNTADVEHFVNSDVFDTNDSIFQQVDVVSFTRYEKLG